MAAAGLPAALLEAARQQVEARLPAPRGEGLALGGQPGELDLGVTRGIGVSAEPLQPLLMPPSHGSRKPRPERPQRAPQPPQRHPKVVQRLVIVLPLERSGGVVGVPEEA